MSERVETATPAPPKQSRRIVALLLIGAGAVIGLSSSGVFSSAAWSVLWPLALIGVGLDLVTEGRQRRRIVVGALIAALICIPIVSAARWFGGEHVDVAEERVEQALPSFEGIDRLRATIALTAGKLSIRDHSDEDQVVTGAAGAINSYSKEGRTGVLDLGTNDWRSRDLDLRFKRDLPLDLTIDLHAGDASPLDFEDLKLERLNLMINGGGDAEIKLPNEGLIEVDIASTAGNVAIDVPDDLAARIEVPSSWSHIDLDDRFEQQDDAYVSEDYNPDAPNRVTIRVDATAGNVRIR
ncbi:MAG TPA: hypothetical protein VFZ66_03110 [Herpetosiphonaceae bacterium]